MAGTLPYVGGTVSQVCEVDTGVHQVQYTSLVKNLFGIGTISLHTMFAAQNSGLSSEIKLS